MTLPLRRRFTGVFGTSDTLCDTPSSVGSAHHPEKTGWIKALATHPVIAIIAGIAHLVGLGRVASTLSSVSLTSLHSVDIGDNFEEYDLTLSPADYGFYVAITPPSGHAALESNSDFPDVLLAKILSRGTSSPKSIE